MKDNLNIIFDKLTSLILVIYIISVTAFENYVSTNWIATYSLYIFMVIALISIILKGKAKFTYYNIIMIIYGVLLALTLYWTKDSSYGFTTFYWYMTCVVITFFVANHVDSIERFYFVINAYILGGIVLSLLLYNIYGLNIFSIAANSKYGIRLGGVIGNSNAIGLSIAFSICFALYMLTNFKHKKNKKIIHIVSIVISLPILFLSGSKKALFVLLFGIIVIFLTYHTDKRIILNKIKGILIIGGLLLLVYWLLNNVSAFWYINQRINEMFFTINGEGASTTDLSRINMVNISLREFSNAPLFGNGIAHSKAIFGTYSHNNYVEILMNTGIVGFLIYYSSYFISTSKTYKLFKQMPKLASIIFFILLTFIIIEVGLVTYYARYYQMLLASISAVIGLKGDIYAKEN